MPQVDCFGNEDIYPKQMDRLSFLLFLLMESKNNQITDNEGHHDDFIIQLENVSFV